MVPELLIIGGRQTAAGGTLVRSRAHVRPHPLHPMLIVFPVVQPTGATGAS